MVISIGGYVKFDCKLNSEKMLHQRKQNDFTIKLHITTD